MYGRNLNRGRQRYAISGAEKKGRFDAYLKNRISKKGILGILSIVLASIFLTVVLVSGMGSAANGQANGIFYFVKVLADRATAFGFFTPNRQNGMLDGEKYPTNENATEETEWHDGTEDEQISESENFEDSQSDSQENSEGNVDETVSDVENEESENTEESHETEETENITDALQKPDGAICITALDMCETEKEYGDIINHTDVRLDASELADVELNGFYAEGSPYPLVMVLHTHTSESYSENGIYYLPDSEKNMLRGVVGVGDRVVNGLMTNGIAAVHCSVIHDGEGNTDSYQRAENSIKAMLEMYPTVKYVIDIHRTAETDGKGNIVATKSELDGISAAQVRINVSVGDGERAERNMSLALKLRENINSEEPNTCRPIVATRYRYNSESSYYYLSVDIGSCGNTYEEAGMAADIFSDALSKVIKHG